VPDGRGGTVRGPGEVKEYGQPTDRQAGEPRYEKDAPGPSFASALPMLCLGDGRIEDQPGRRLGRTGRDRGDEQGRQAA